MKSKEIKYWRVSRSWQASSHSYFPHTFKPSKQLFTSAEEVGGHEDALGEVLEGLEAGNALLLLELAVDADRGEVAVLQQAGQLHRALHLAHEDHHLKREDEKRKVKKRSKARFGRFENILRIDKTGCIPPTMMKKAQK